QCAPGARATPKQKLTQRTGGQTLTCVMEAVSVRFCFNSRRVGTQPVQDQVFALHSTGIQRLRPIFQPTRMPYYPLTLWLLRSPRLVLGLLERKKETRWENCRRGDCRVFREPEGRVAQCGLAYFCSELSESLTSSSQSLVRSALPAPNRSDAGQ